MNEEYRWTYGPHIPLAKFHWWYGFTLSLLAICFLSLSYLSVRLPEWIRDGYFTIPDKIARVGESSLDMSRLQNSVDALSANLGGLTNNIGGLTKKIDESRFNQSNVVSTPQISETTELEGNTSIEFSWSTAIFLGIAIAFVGLFASLSAIVMSRSGSPRAVAVAAASSVLIGTAGAAGLKSLIGKVDIKSIFSCEKGCVTLALGSMPTAQQALKPSPSFDVGSADFLQRTWGCINSDMESRKNEVENWLQTVEKAWLNRKPAREHDTLIIVGSADRLHLVGGLVRQYGSNVGLARARAETVKKLLFERTKDLAPVNRLTDARVLVLTTGPAGTSGHLPRVREKNELCKEHALALDRAVFIWMNASSTR
jgi:hypothetical protein